MKIRQKKPFLQPPIVYPWRDGNQVWLWHDGQSYFSRLLQLIEQAQRHIWIELYWFASDATGELFIQALIKAVNRGVNVLCLFDAVGSRTLRAEDRHRLLSSGIKLSIYNPLSLRSPFKFLKRDHRKVWVFDQRIALVGGAGVADEFMGSNKEPAWRDVLFELQGPVLQDFVDYFLHFWRACAGDLTVQEHLNHANNYANNYANDQVIADAQMLAIVSARLVLGRGARTQSIKQHGLRRIRQARTSIWMFTGYFYPNRKLRKALLDAAERGVAVKLLLPGARSDHPLITEAGRHYYPALLSKGVEIFELNPRFQHMKLMVCDHWVSFGSSNQDRWNERWNLEANVEVESREFVAQIHQAFAEDFLTADKIEWHSWVQRPWWRRAVTYGLYRVAVFIEFCLMRLSD